MKLKAFIASFCLFFSTISVGGNPHEELERKVKFYSNDKFYSELARVTESRFNRIFERIESQDKSLAKKVREYTVRSAKKLNLYKFAKEQLFSGLKGQLLVSTEVVSFVVGAKLFALMAIPPVWVTTLGFVPFSIFTTLPIYNYLSRKHHQLKLARELGVTVRDVVKLEKLRGELIGNALDRGLLNVVIDMGEEENEEITVIKRGFSKIFRKKPKGYLVEISELEKIIEKSGKRGKRLLKAISRDAAKSEAKYGEGGDILKASLYFYYINKDQSLREKFEQLVAKRVEEAKLDVSVVQHAIFNRIHEKNLYLNMMKEDLGDLKRRLSAYFDKENSLLKELVSTKREELRKLEFEIKVMEIDLVRKINEDGSIGRGLIFEDEAKASLKRVKEIEKWINDISIFSEIHSKRDSLKDLSKKIIELSENSRTMYIEVNDKIASMSKNAQKEIELIHDGLKQAEKDLVHLIQRKGGVEGGLDLSLVNTEFDSRLKNLNEWLSRLQFSNRNKDIRTTLAFIHGHDWSQERGFYKPARTCKLISKQVSLLMDRTIDFSTP